MTSKTNTDRDAQRMIKRRTLIAESGFRRFGEGVAKEAELCFSDENRPLGKLLDMIQKGFEVLEAGLHKEVEASLEEDKSLTHF